MLTSPLREASEISQHVRAARRRVKDIALAVPDATEAYRQAVQRGARGVVEPHWVEDEDGGVELAAIATYGDTIHTFVNRSDYAGAYLPGYEALDGARDDGVGLRAIDHCVGNVELGQMNHWVEFYEQVFGMTEMIHFSDEDISTEYSALMSKVMTDGQGKIKFPINEPAEGKRKSQIEEYLDFHGGPGVQHIAMSSADIVGTVEALQERGVPFLDDARRVLRRRLRPRRRDRRELRRPAPARHPRRPRRRRLPAADLHEDRAGPADALLRGDRAPRRARLRRRQLQGAVRGDRARAGAAGEPVGMPFYVRLGDVPRKRHIQYRENGTLLTEEVMGLEGFTGNESILYHVTSPCRVKELGPFEPIVRDEWVPDAHAHRHFTTWDVPEGGDAITGRQAR